MEELKVYQLWKVLLLCESLGHIYLFNFYALYESEK